MDLNGNEIREIALQCFEPEEITLLFQFVRACSIADMKAMEKEKQKIKKEYERAAFKTLQEDIARFEKQSAKSKILLNTLHTNIEALDQYKNEIKKEIKNEIGQRIEREAKEQIRASLEYLQALKDKTKKLEAQLKETESKIKQKNEISSGLAATDRIFLWDDEISEVAKTLDSLSKTNKFLALDGIVQVFSNQIHKILINRTNN